MQRILFLVGILMLAIPATGAHAGPLKVLFGCSEELRTPCEVTFSVGGQIEIFQDAAQEALVFHIPVVFKGPCDSACTLFADIVRGQACIQEAAAFGFHNFERWPHGSLNSSGIIKPGTQPLGFLVPTYSPELTGLLKPHGNLPNGEPLLFIKAAEAVQVWPRC